LYARQVLVRALSRARAVVAVSSSTAEQLRRIGLPGNRIRVVRNGVDAERFARPSPEEVAEALAPLRLTPGYLLYVSRIEHPAKNHRNLLDAYAIVRRRCPNTPPLVLAGKDWDGAEVVHRRADQPDIREHVRFTGYVSEEVLPALYAGARALVFPSLAEGFGLPLLEAMAAGCPVLCSDRPPMNEIVGEAGYCFEPEYPEDIADGLELAVCDEQWREGLIARGHQRVLRYTWTVTAQALWRLAAA
jgi:glycosyltransferase involved in cell wall biosynthesis